MAENDQDLAAIVRELAATKTTPITAVGVDKPVTLRAAISNVYWKASSVLKLTGRPRDPRVGDDQFGHILSLRAEVLVLRTLVTAMARKQGLDVDKLVADTLEAIQ
jgi:hypothetical protein